MPARLFAMFLVLCLVWSTLAFAQDAIKPADEQPVDETQIQTEQTEETTTVEEAAWPESKYAPLAIDSPYMTGDWGGARTALEDFGLKSQLFYTNTTQWNVKGGRDTGSHNGGTIDYLGYADFDKMGLIPGGRGLIHVKREWGTGINPFVGSIWQVQDDQDGDRTIYIDQLWYEQELVKDQLWFKFGFLDFQTIFDRNKFSNSEDKHFFNQGFDNNPVLPLNIGLGIAMRYQPCKWFSIATAAGDAAGTPRKGGFSTAFHDSARFVWFLEPAIHLQLPNPFGEGTLDGNYRFGMLYDPRSRNIYRDARLPAAWQQTRGDDVGFYINFDQKLYRENAVDQQGLGWFFRYAYRHGDIQRVQNFWSTGLVYQGLVPSRDNDLFGMAVLQSIPSRQFNDKINRLAEAETVFECFYAFYVTKWLVVSPDIQYISSPGIDSTLDDSAVLGIRTRISF